MREHAVWGWITCLAGLVQERVGRWVGSPAQQRRGLQKQVLGRADMRRGGAGARGAGRAALPRRPGVVVQGHFPRRTR